MSFLSEIAEMFWSVFKTFRFSDAVDIIIVAFIIYSLFKFLRQTRAAQLVKGLAVLIVAYVLSAVFELTMVNFILTTVFEFAAIILVILFQPEIRKALERLGRRNFSKNAFKSVFNTNTPDAVTSMVKAIDDVCDVSLLFSRSKTGALIVFERTSLLTEIASSGTMLNSDTSVALLGNIFFNKAPLHDGACIIRDGKILSAGCILPLTDNNNLNSSLGTRHRAAIGMSEETDAVVVVVSEETGTTSLAVGGRLTRDFDSKQLKLRLMELLVPNESEKTDLLTVLFRGRKEKNNDKQK